MRHESIASFILLILLAVAMRAHGEVKWYVQASNGAHLASGGKASGQNIVIEIGNYTNGPATRIRVFADNPTTEDIGPIYITGNIASPQTIFLHVDLLEAPPSGMYTGTTYAAGRDWGGVSNSYNGAVVVSGCVNRHLLSGFSGNGGPSIVYVDYVYINGAIQNGFGARAGAFMVQANGGVASGANITCESGNLTSVMIPSGSLFANIKSLTGNIVTIAVGGDIGTSSTPVSIWTATGIDVISAANMYADVQPGAYTPFTGTLTNLTTTGDLGGTARTLGFNTISIGGNLVGTLSLKGLAPFPAGKTITIGHSLASTGRIAVSTAEALGGQVIINKNDTGGTWASGAEVQVGPVENQTVLTSSTYSVPSSTIGGGAVGLARYQLHEADCLAPDAYNVVNARAIVAHYGPVTWTTGTPVTVAYRLAGSSDDWTDITGYFIVEPTSNPREIAVVTQTTLDFDMLLDYRIKPVLAGSNALKCVGVDDTPPVADYEYIILGSP